MLMHVGERPSRAAEKDADSFLMMKKKHIALRTCIICGNKASKRSLVRIVASSENVIELDVSGRKLGRGAYVCSDGICVQQGIKRARVEHVLRAKVNEEDWGKLVSSLSGLQSKH